MMPSKTCAILFCAKQLFASNRGSGGSSRRTASSSGRNNPELNAPGATTTTGPPSAANTVTDLADATAVSEGMTLFSGLELALDILGGSTQWVVAGAVGVALVSRADVDTLVFVVGSLFNAVFSKVLKKTINQVRAGRGGSGCCR